jgi:hypothetical protein
MLRIRTAVVALTFALLASAMTQPAAAWVNSDFATWPTCSTQVNDKCLESISISTDQESTWIPLQQSGGSSQIYSLSNTGYVPVASESQISVNVQQMTSVGELPGQDSTEQLYFDIMPYSNGTSSRKPMNESVIFKFVVRAGDYKPSRYSGMAKNLITTYATVDGINKITLQASPLKMAYVDNQTQAVCESPISVASGSSAYFNVVALKFLNDSNAELVNVVANGSCGSGFNLEQQVGMLYPEIHYKTVGPHFLSDGVTLNVGYFEATLSADFLSQKMLITQEQALNGGLAISAAYTSSLDTPVTYTITAMSDGGVKLVAEGFHFSAPTMKIKRAVGKVSTKSKFTAKQIANAAGMQVPTKAKATLTVSKSSAKAKLCKISGGKLITLKKKGNCVVTVRVQPAKVKGKKVTARVATYSIRIE